MPKILVHQKRQPSGLSAPKAAQRLRERRLELHCFCSLTSKWFSARRDSGNGINRNTTVKRALCRRLPIVAPETRRGPPETQAGGASLGVLRLRRVHSVILIEVDGKQGHLPRGYQPYLASGLPGNRTVPGRPSAGSLRPLRFGNGPQARCALHLRRLTISAWARSRAAAACAWTGAAAPSCSQMAQRPMACDIAFPATVMLEPMGSGGNGTTLGVILGRCTNGSYRPGR